MGIHLSESPEIRGLFFTGSFRTGMALLNFFAKHPEKILALEMGGNNPLVVTPVSDIKSAALMTIQSAFITSGQRCTCARRLILPKGDFGDQFLTLLIEVTSKLNIGPFTKKPEPFMGPVISKAQAVKLELAEAALIANGARPLLRLKREDPEGAFVTPSLLDVTDCKKVSDEEIFGPVLQVHRYDDFEEALNKANQTAYGLAASLISDSPEEWEQFYERIKAGVINWNCPTTGASSQLPFGGVGHSGNFRASAFYAADYTAYPVSSQETNKLTPPKQIPPGIPSF